MEQAIVNYIKNMYAMEETPEWTPNYEGVIFYDKKNKIWVIGRENGWQLIDRRYKIVPDVPTINWIDPFEYSTDEYLKSKWKTLEEEVPWTPEEITTSLWLDAADSDTLTLDGSNNVEQWGDKSGNEYHLSQNTAGERPSIQTGFLNNKDTLRFDGADDYLSYVSASELPVKCVYCVVDYKQIQADSVS